MFDFLTPESLAALAALSAMEIILGIDNVIFISVLVSRLPKEQGERARKLGLLMALGMRIMLLFALTTLLKLTQPVLTFGGFALSWRDIILLAGGMFLVVKATHEMHMEMEGGDHLVEGGGKAKTFFGAMVQIAVIDLVFSIDSMVTAIGMARDLWVMVVAVLISMAVMYAAAGPVSAFIMRHPTAKVLALAFLILIGVALVAEGFHSPIDKKFIYSAMAFAVFIEAVNMRISSKRKLRHHLRGEQEAADLQAGASASPADMSDKAKP